MTRTWCCRDADGVRARRLGAMASKLVATTRPSATRLTLRRVEPAIEKAFNRANTPVADRATAQN